MPIHPGRRLPTSTSTKRRRTTIQASDSVGDSLLVRSAFQIRLARSVEWHKPRSGRGTLCQSRAADAPSHIILQACDRHHVFGTVDVCFESNARLPADASFGAEMDSYRTGRARLAQVTRLAIDAGSASEAVLGALFHVAYVFIGIIYEASDIFTEVHPRHAEFYRRMLNFKPVSAHKMCPRVGAPAVLLHLETAYVREQVALFGGGRGEEQTLYPYFCSAREESGVLRRALLSLTRSAASKPSNA